MRAFEKIRIESNKKIGEVLGLKRARERKRVRAKKTLLQHHKLNILTYNFHAFDSMTSSTR